MDKTNDASNKIREYIFNHFRLARQRSIPDSALLLDSGIIDSMGILDLVGFLEGEFKISISDEDLLPENFQSISHVATFVESKSHDSSASHQED